MPSITIRKLPSQTKERLRVQAAQSGLSLEAHVRGVLQRVAEEPVPAAPDLAALASQCFGQSNGVELTLPPRGQAREAVRFD